MWLKLKSNRCVNATGEVEWSFISISLSSTKGIDNNTHLQSIEKHNAHIFNRLDEFQG